MDYRKLIKFGNNSYVISLPKEWLKKNQLDKGNLIYLNENGNNEIVLAPTLVEKKKEIKNLTINVDGKTLAQIKRELISAYLNDYTIIKLKGEDIERNAKDLRVLTQNLMALEIIEQTKNEIVTRDFLNLRDISPTEFIRKMDIITRSLLGDLPLCLDKDLFSNIENREQDVNVISFVILRVIRRGLEDPEYAKNIQLTPLQLFELWNITSYVELIADQIREVAMVCPQQDITPKQKQFAKDTIKKIENIYLDVMKAYYNNDPHLAHKVTHKKNELIHECKESLITAQATKAQKASLASYSQLIERLITLAKEINKIARRVYS